MDPCAIFSKREKIALGLLLLKVMLLEPPNAWSRNTDEKTEYFAEDRMRRCCRLTKIVRDITNRGKTIKRLAERKLDNNKFSVEIHIILDQSCNLVT